MPFITMMLPRVTGSSIPAPRRRITNQREMSSIPSPTTVKPMTEPEEKATRSPLFRLSLAAWAVRALEFVAIFIPTRPASMDQIPPVRKAKGVNLESMAPPVPKAMASSRRNTTTKTLATVAYWCDRYALAPERMAEAIFFMASLPSEKASTRLLCSHANRIAAAAPRKPIQYKFSKSIHAPSFRICHLSWI